MKYDQRYTEWLAGARWLVYSERMMTQTELADRTGVARPHLNGVLRGRLEAGAALQDRIATELGYTHDELRSIGREHGTQVLPVFTPENGSLANGGVHVNNGGIHHVNGAVQGCGKALCPRRGQIGDIARELCGAIVKQLDGAEMDEQIAFRASFQRFMRQYKEAEQSERV